MADTPTTPAPPKPGILGVLMAWAGVVLIYMLNPVLWIALALVFVLTSCGVQTWRISNLKHDVAARDQQIASMTTAIKEQNQAVEGLSRAAKALTTSDAKRVDAAVLAVQRAGVTLSKQVAGIKAAKPGPDTCASALDLMHGAGQ
jgi:cell division protein FtsB